MADSCLQRWGAKKEPIFGITEIQFVRKVFAYSKDVLYTCTFSVPMVIHSKVRMKKVKKAGNACSATRSPILALKGATAQRFEPVHICPVLGRWRKFFLSAQITQRVTCTSDVHKR
jgi:hypothetical protein